MLPLENSKSLGCATHLGEIFRGEHDPKIINGWIVISERRVPHHAGLTHQPGMVNAAALFRCKPALSVVQLEVRKCDTTSIVLTSTANSTLTSVGLLIDRKIAAVDL